MTSKTGMELISSHWGLRNAIAKRLGITKGAIYQWKEVPAKHCVKLEALFGIPREILRPDLFERRPIDPEVLSRLLSHSLKQADDKVASKSEKKGLK